MTELRQHKRVPHFDHLHESVWSVDGPEHCFGGGEERKLQTNREEAIIVVR